uniref:Uncharacterized protein n=1 Tax=Arundo donax TaxID=35708 RepID=A0A0A9BW14_ARUDO
MQHIYWDHDRFTIIYLKPSGVSKGIEQSF